MSERTDEEIVREYLSGVENEYRRNELFDALDRLADRLAAVEDALRPFIENVWVITGEWSKRTYGDGYIFSRAALDEDGTQRVWGFTIEDIETLAAAADTNQAESA